MSKPHIPWSVGLITFCKYTRFQYTLFLPLILVFSVLFSSCSTTSNFVTIPLSPMELDDKRFLDTLEESTMFYFDLFNFDGYDRYSNTVFEDLKYRLVSRSSIEYPKTKITAFEGMVFRKGLHTEYVVYGIFKNEPELYKSAANKLDSNVQKTAMKPVPIKIPASVSLLLESKLSSLSEKDEIVKAKKDEEQTVNSRDMRLIIIACFRESYFHESMLVDFKNPLSEIDYYTANGWVRIYLVDYPGYRIYDAQAIFPDAWRANYGD